LLRAPDAMNGHVGRSLRWKLSDRRDACACDRNACQSRTDDFLGRFGTRLVARDCS
jgi:hypothetical protein